MHWKYNSDDITKVAAAAQGDMEAFVKALQNKGDKKDDKDKEEDMALD